MDEKITQLKSQLDSKLSEIKNLVDLDKIRVEFLGKKGSVTSLLKGMKNLSGEERKEFGKMVNDLKQSVAQTIEEKTAELKRIEVEAEINSMPLFDITTPVDLERGSYHPITLVQRQCESIFKSMGFTVEDYAEVVTDYECFESVNIPKHHPARDMQDTFYITENILLRTHTSPGQVHVMTTQKPPIKVMCPGRVYRSYDDATHSPIFHQIEGLVVDKNLSLCDLKGSLEEILRKVFNSDIKTRLRPSYFPFTEPSVEVDVSCFECGGKGCKLCKGTGWIEVLGAGMVNRSVLKNCGIDPDVYTGYAFGIGLERIAMLKYHIPDIRMFFDNDLRFLKQFR